MKKIMQYTGVFALAILMMSFASGDDKVKKTKKFTASRIIPASADKVWKIVAEDYGNIAKMHPEIVYSDYVSGSLKGGEGAERVCHFNESGTRFVKEKMVDWDPENYSFKNTVYQAGRFPVDQDLTYAIYKLRPIDDNSCEFIFNMEFRAKPAMMGGMMKKRMSALVQDYFIAVEHHVTTGEVVTKENFKDIKKNYTK